MGTDVSFGHVACHSGHRVLGTLASASPHAHKTQNRHDLVGINPDRFAVPIGHRRVDDERTICTSLEGVCTAWSRLAWFLPWPTNGVAGSGNVPPDLRATRSASYAVFQRLLCHTADAIMSSYLKTYSIECAIRLESRCCIKSDIENGKVMQHAEPNETVGSSIRSGSATEPLKACYATSNLMAATTTKARGNEERTQKHRKVHKLLQTWVSPEMWKAAAAKAKSEKRTVANWMRCELGKLLGVDE